MIEVASVHPKPMADGSTAWRVQYRVGGKQRTDAFRDHAEAVAHAALVQRLGGDVARRILDAREGSRGEQTVSQMVASHIDRMTDDDAHSGTRRTYRGYLINHIDGTALGALPIGTVTRDDVRQWLDGMTGAAKSRRNVHALLSAAFQRVVDDEALSRNPARGLRIKSDAPSEGMVILNRGELAVLLSEMSPRYRPLIAFLAGTGLRWSEATALLVSDVDLDAATPLVRVNKAWKRLGTSWQVGPPKSRAGDRVVGLSPAVVSEIVPLLERRGDAYLFTTERADWIRNNTFQATHWQPALRRLNKSGRMTKRPRLHDLRHYYASTLVAQGVPLNIVQQQMGHEDIRTTVNRYSHMQPNYLAVAAAAAADGLALAVPEIEG
jgi:integrase